MFSLSVKHIITWKKKKKINQPSFDSMGITKSTFITIKKILSENMFFSNIPRNTQLVGKAE